MPDNLEPHVPEEGVLRSWKEIAAWFQVDPRTVQNWERERGLPVFRLPGPKGRVFANIADLQRWRQGHLPPSPEPVVERPPSRRLYWIAAAIVFLLLITFAAFNWPSSRPAPSAWSLDGRTLTVRGVTGSVLWRHVFETEPDRYWERSADESRPFFADLDGDGVLEFLFRFNLGPYPTDSDILFCFQADGRIRWRYQSVKAARSGKPEEFPPPYLLRALSLVNLDARRRALALATYQVPWYACRIVLLSHAGQEIAEYWHSGHLNAIRAADRNRDGRDEIYLTGVSNSRHRATLVVLDPASMAGASREDDPNFQLLDLPPPVEIARLLFPRSHLNLESPFNYNIGTHLHVQNDSLLVSVQEFWSPIASGGLIYTLDRSLRVKSVGADDGFARFHGESLASGKIRLPLEQQLRSLQSDIVYLTAPQ